MAMTKMSRGDLDQLRDLIRQQKRLRPEGPTVRVTVHLGTCGLASGAQAVLDALEQEVKNSKRRDIEVTCSGCIGLCSHEPMITIETLDADAIIYHSLDADKMRRIFLQHLMAGRAVAEFALLRGTALGEGLVLEDRDASDILPVSLFPFFARQESLVLRNRGRIHPERIEEAIGYDAYQGLARALFELKPAEIIAEVKESGLRGRGGGGFPTGLKWDFCRSAKGDLKYVLCNADEGDPGAFMDRSVMEGDPHAVLEGMIIAARAIGASQGYIYCRAEYPLAVATLEKAIRQAHKRGLLGKDILGSGFDFDLEIYQGAGAFVCGEETALMTSIEGLRGTPRPRPPFPAVSGLWAKPTVLNNVETYANIAQIVLRGGEEYAGRGTESATGTKVFALTGKVNRVGLVEVPMGTPLGEIIYDIGGGIPHGKKFKAAQLGGPSGGCLPVEHLNTPTEYEAITEAGAIMGSGGLIVMDEDSCMVDMARYFMEFCQEESCGQCSPCRIGTRRMLEILERICAGQGRAGDIELLEDLSQTIKDAALCGLGQTAPNPVLSTLRYFRAEYEAHIHEHRCPAGVCAALVRSPCQNSCPVGMDIPAYVALAGANRLDDAYRVLLRSNPFPSVCGRICSHPCESKCRREQLDEPLAIRSLKRFITDHAQRPPVEALPTTQPEKIALIGAGPSGLSAALELRKRGYAVCVFEQMPAAGGMLRWAIPAYRLPRKVLDDEIEAILATGVELRCGIKIGADLSLHDLQQEYQAVYLAPGAQQSQGLDIPGDQGQGVLGAVEMLRDYHQDQAVAIGKRVVVIGGGNTAVDAARTALRLGAEEVTIAYRRERKDMPALAEEIRAAEEEGIMLHELAAPVQVLLQGDRVTGIELSRMRLGNFDRSGRKKPIADEGDRFRIEADTVISAIGQAVNADFLSGRAELQSKWGTLVADKGQKTPDDLIWAGGDAVTGPAMAIDAIRAGQEAANSIDQAIRTRKGEAPWTAATAEKIEIPLPTEQDARPRARLPLPEADPRTRAQDFREVELGYGLVAAQAEARRCLRCDVVAE